VIPLPAPGVSVCIPATQAEPYLAETIRSVLDQTYRDFELVVLDNASPDRADIIARRVGDVRIRVERTAAPVPQAEHWNRVVQLSRAQLVKLVRPTRGWRWWRHGGTWSTSTAGSWCPGAG
jgi:glycosyltransferase involved in cell wall biosynthesis